MYVVFLYSGLYKPVFHFLYLTFRMHRLLVLAFLGDVNSFFLLWEQLIAVFMKLSLSVHEVDALKVFFLSLFCLNFFFSKPPAIIDILTGLVNRHDECLLIN